jgi:hypothetical protein
VPPGEIIAFVTDYSPVDEAAYEALHNFWKSSPPHNDILVGKIGNGGCYKFSGIAVAHALRTFSGVTKWLWVAELVTDGVPTPSPPPPSPTISQVGRAIPSTYNPALNSRPIFQVTLRNNSAYDAQLREVFLRLRHQTSGSVLHVDLWPSTNGTVVISPGGTRTFTGRPPALNQMNLWEVEKIEIQTSAGQWLPGIHQYGWLLVGQTNFALNRPVNVHSVREGSGNVPSRVNDGSPTTRWESAWYDDQMIEIDLGQQRTVDTVVLHWEGAYAKVFRVKLGSNCGSNPGQCTWTQVYTTSNGQGNSTAITFSNKPARWVKVELVERATPWGFSLWEFEVYNR